MDIARDRDQKNRGIGEKPALLTEGGLLLALKVAIARFGRAWRVRKSDGDRSR
jgi:hypothetical protein